jgi:diaminohydroxyphosphoribosylaminopyrimidine deaminase / 5-amino-6-(5-phosphoribosylamino)uracil reductase
MTRCDSGADSDSLDGRSWGPGWDGASLPRRQPVACLPSPAAPLEDAVDHPDDLIDRRFMAEALALAARVPRRPWPNPPVGAVLVRNGEVVGRGSHHGAGTDHAEVAALREAGGRARGATLYCTLEPCNHDGRTPPCAPAVAAAGVSRAVVAMADPNPTVCGGGLRRLRDNGLDTRNGVLADQALELLWPFVATRAFERPFVVLKTAASLDGFLAPLPDRGDAGQPFYLTGHVARRDVHRMRRWCDVILVGERTMAADSPRLDGRLVEPGDACPAADPIPAYVDSDLSLCRGWPRAHLVFAGAAATRSRRAVVEDLGATVVACEERNGRVDPRSLVARARDLGAHVVLVEGGPTLAASFLEHDLVDRWVSYVAPVVLGAGVRWPDGGAHVSFHLTRVERMGPDVKAVFDRTSFDDTLAAVSGAAGGR